MAIRWLFTVIVHCVKFIAVYIDEDSYFASLFEYPSIAIIPQILKKDTVILFLNGNWAFRYC